MKSPRQLIFPKFHEQLGKDNMYTLGSNYIAQRSCPTKGKNYMVLVS